MANDDRQSQQFIREVDEELRRAQLKSVWDRFAPLIIGVCILVVAVTAGYRGWLWWQERQAAEAGDRFMAALESLGGGNRAEGEAELAAIAAEGDGYSVLARFRLAGEKAAAGEKQEAIAAYDQVAADSSVSAPMRGLARMRAALLALDTDDVEGARRRAEPLDGPGNPWRHAAREVLGTAAYQGGRLQQARDYFTAIQQDAEAPQDLWVRSAMMVALIDGQLAAPGAEGEPPIVLEGPASAAGAPAAAAPEPLPAQENPRTDSPDAAPGAAPEAAVPAEAEAPAPPPAISEPAPAIPAATPPRTPIPPQ